MGKTPQWKNDGEQDKFIVKLIREGKIHKATKPAFLKATYPSIFGTFSLNVIRNHLNLLKRSSGLFLVDLSEEQIGEVENSQQEEEEEEANCIDSKDSKDSSRESNLKISCSHENYPILCNSFKDPITHMDKVILAIGLPGGSKRVTIDVDDDGMSAIIKYKWPKTLYDMNDLFASRLSQGRMKIYHPMIGALTNMLENVRCRIDSSPETVIKVPLPIKVQSNVESTEKWGVKRLVGTKVVVGVFTGYVKIYSKKIADSHVTFDN